MAQKTFLLASAELEKLYYHQARGSKLLFVSKRMAQKTFILASAELEKLYYHQREARNSCLLASAWLKKPLY